MMGEDFVAAALGKATAFTAPLQEHITRNAWGDVWQRDGLDLDRVSFAEVSGGTGCSVGPGGLALGGAVARHRASGIASNHLSGAGAPPFLERVAQVHWGNKTGLLSKTE